MCMGNVAYAQRLRNDSGPPMVQWSEVYTCLAYAVREVALSPEEAALERFGAAARVGAKLTRAGLLRHHGVIDRLANAARAYGLVRRHGVDVVQSAMSEAFHAQ
jgi:hypothetical protein